MGSFRLQFSGEVRKPQTKTIGADQAIEFHLMRKNFGKADPATFTWIRITLFKPAAWQFEQVQEGKFIAGSGEFTLRSFVDKDGLKRQSAEVRAQSFDIDGPRTGEAQVATPAPAPKPMPAPTAKDDDSEPPF